MQTETAEFGEIYEDKSVYTPALLLLSNPLRLRSFCFGDWG